MSSNKHVFSKEIIKEYDIRGKYEENLNEADAYFLGCSLGTYLKRSNITGKICVAYDGRKSSPKLKKSLISGFLDVGLNVVELGLVPTPLLYYACHNITDVFAGIIVTASHNPKEYNGFKIVVKKQPLFGNSLKRLSSIATSGEFEFSQFPGKVESLDINQEYIESVTNPHIHFSRIKHTDLKIVWDVSNGTAGNILKEITRKLPGQHIIINDEINGDFPSHSPDPTKEENLQQIKEVIHKERGDFGIVFDGDADRLVLINKDDRVFYGDQLLAFFANDLLRRHPKAKIIVDIKTSKIVLDEIKRLGGIPIVWKTGHSNIKAKMLEEDAILAGEVSGHLFFKENYHGYDDALFAACKLVFLFLDKEHKNYFTNLTKSFVSPEIRIPCKEKQKTNVICRIRNILDNMSVKYIALDGIRVESAKGWWLVRASNTEESLVIRVEGYSQHNFDFILRDLSNILQKIGIRNFSANLKFNL